MNTPIFPFSAGQPVRQESVKLNTLTENLAFGFATLVFGIMAGFFWTYSFNVNWAMLEVSGETYATVQSLFNENVRHGYFFFFFFGGGFFPLLALLVNRRHWSTLAFWLVVAAALIYIFGVIVFTQQVNLPLNYTTEGWDPQNLPADWTVIRDRWNAANNIRVGTAGSAFALSLLALVLRATR
ncbi:MAG: DUF1772 domain-containing protein [Chloroflexota bacterium]